MKNKKYIIALALLSLVGIIGGTYAYFTSSATFTHDIVTGVYSTSVTEEFISPDNWVPGSTASNKVSVINSGSSIDIVARIKYTGRWIAKDGTELSGVRNGENVALFTIGSDWIEGNDGYYYYKYKLSEGEESSDFISSVTFNPNFDLEDGTDIDCVTTIENGKTIVTCENLDSGYGGATFYMDITVETIQAANAWTAYKTKWYYNGVEFPSINSTGLGDNYDFAVIGTYEGKTGLLLSNKIPVYDPVDYNGLFFEGAHFVSYYFLTEDKWKLYQKNEYQYYSHIIPDSIIWTNVDVVNASDNTVYFAGSTPETKEELIVFEE